MSNVDGLVPIGGTKDNLQNQLQQQPCGCITGLPVRPYLHHSTTMTLLGTGS